ncbi:hypothetical protein HWV62_27061 [Athelia sp. TMB]|nr:hypothetical protein HWV62_27061 [Athelia sp. TMB]
MCCNGYLAPTTTDDTESDHIDFDETLVATPLPDGYWLNAFPFSKDVKLPDLVGFGLGFKDKPATIKLFLNPKNDKSTEQWKMTEIQSLEYPVSMVYADITGDGFNDIIICDRYGSSTKDLWDANGPKKGGRIQWLRNPGKKDSSEPYWEPHVIGNSTAGHFSTRNQIQVMGLPIMASSNNHISPAPVTVYTAPNPPFLQGMWSEDIAFPTQFRLIHEARLIPGGAGELDMVLVAGQEGIALLWYEEEAKNWAYRVVGTGLPKTSPSPFTGCGSVDVVRVGGDSVGYIATCEALHGNIVSVYVKGLNAHKGPASLKLDTWTRIEVDNFGPLDKDEHTGTVHTVAAIAVRKEECESFAIACMGAPENQGVYIYSPIDIANGKFKRTRITNESAAHLAIAGFTDPKIMDIGSISYYVPGYHTGPDPPSVRISSIRLSKLITVTKRNKEVVLDVPRPKTLPRGEFRRMDMMTIAGKKLSLIVLGPRAEINLARDNGVKVIYGSIVFKDKAGRTVTRENAIAAKTVETTLLAEGLVTAGTDGAVFLYVELLEGQNQGPYDDMSKVTIKNEFPEGVPANVRAMQFLFTRVDRLGWPNSKDFTDFEFYNMSGIYVYFNDDAMEQIVHMQAWTLGIGETARFHNHDQKSFCEVHYYLYNGGGEGTVRYYKDTADSETVDLDKELTKAYVEERAQSLVVKTMNEHGPLWNIEHGFDPGSNIAARNLRPKLRKNDTAQYPWHGSLASKFGDYKLPHLKPVPNQSFDLWLAFEFPTSAFQD